MKRLSVTACVLFAAAIAFAGEGDFAFHASYSFDLKSAYISRGKVLEDRPIQANDLDVHVDLWRYGRLGVSHWNYSSLSGHFQDEYRRFVPETDWGLYYGYDWEFAEGYSLDTELMVYWELSHGGRPKSGHTDYEWRMKETLKTPFGTVYCKIRHNFEPIMYTYYQIGLKRRFALTGWMNVIPHAYVDMGDERCRQKRFGALEDGGRYGDGGLSAAGELVFEFPLAEHVTLTAKVGQFGVVSHRGRRNLHAPHRRDLTYGAVGVTFEF